MQTFNHSKLPLAAATLAAITTFGLAGCGSSAESTSNTVPSGMSGGQGRFPGANGTIAAVSGNTVQVQSANAQTAVTYDSSTQITKTTAATLTQAKVGDCVSANGSADTGSITAQTIRITAATNGECATNAPSMPAGGGQPPQGGQGYAPPDGNMSPPAGAPSGGPAGAGFTLATGKITSKTATSIVVAGELMTRGDNGPSSSAGTVTINVTSDTTYTSEQKANSSAIKVGACARAIGQANDKGTISATSLNISEPTNGECQLGFGGQRSGAQ